MTRYDQNAMPLQSLYTLRNIGRGFAYWGRVMTAVLALIQVDDTDPRIKYSAGWSSGGVDAEYNATTHGTTVEGASVVFSFSGTHVEVYGTLHQLNASEPAPISTYTLDDLSPITLIPTRQTHPQYQQLFYSSPVVDDGDHVLAISSTIEDSHFWLDYFSYSPSSPSIVDTGSIASLDDTFDSSQLSSPSQPGSNRNDALLGALIGALVALVLLLCAVAFVYHRTRRRQNLKATALPFVIGPPPIPRPRTRPTRRRPELSLDDRLAASEAGPLPPMRNVFGHDEGDRVRASVVPSTPSSHQYLSPRSRPALYCQNDIEGATRKEKN